MQTDGVIFSRAKLQSGGYRWEALDRSISRVDSVLNKVSDGTGGLQLDQVCEGDVGKLVGYNTAPPNPADDSEGQSPTQSPERSPSATGSEEGQGLRSEGDRDSARQHSPALECIKDAHVEKQDGGSAAAASQSATRAASHSGGDNIGAAEGDLYAFWPSFWHASQLHLKL